MSEPTPRVGQQHGGVASDRLGEPLFEVVDLLAQRQDALGQQVQGVDRRAGDILRCAGFQLRTVTDEHGGAQIRQHLT